MAREARERGLAFAPSVAPGYDDSKIRPWNAATRVERRGGATYAAAWEAALAAEPPVVTVTSANEWGEGTQIAPAAPRALDVDALAARGAALPRATRERLRLRSADAYEDYGAGGPGLYLEMTARFSARLAAAAPRAPPADAEAEARRYHAEL